MPRKIVVTDRPNTVIVRNRPLEPIKEGPGMFRLALKQAGLSEKQYRAQLARYSQLDGDARRPHTDFGWDRQEKERLGARERANEIQKELASIRRAEYVEFDVMPFEEKLAEAIPNTWKGRIVSITSWRNQFEADAEPRDGEQSFGVFPMEKGAFVRYFRAQFFGDGAEWFTDIDGPNRREVLVAGKPVNRLGKEDADNPITQVDLVPLERFTLTEQDVAGRREMTDCLV